MRQLLKKLWNDAVWSKVIAGIILAVGATIASYFLDWWPAIGRFATRSYVFTKASSSISNWLLLLLGLLALPTVLITGAVVWQKIFPKSAGSSWRNYTSDIFFGLRWRWRYFDDGQIYDVHTFCPYCDFQVYALNVSAFRVVDHIAFQCDGCGRRLGDFQESFESLEDKTTRFIQQKIRNGTWNTQNSF